MKPCFCRLSLAILVIVFAWWHVSWANIALTIIGAILAVMALFGSKCCCSDKLAAKKE
jgi:hypothetical protein